MSIIQYGHRVLSQAHGTQRRRPGQVGRAQTRHRQLQATGTGQGGSPRQDRNAHTVQASEGGEGRY